MRIVLFDPGDTLEHRGHPRAGAATVLAALAAWRGSEGHRAQLALLSDFDIAASPAHAKQLRKEFSIT